jgi:hypothetical protein
MFDDVVAQVGGTLLGQPIGSLADLATFVLVLVLVLGRLRPRVATIAAAVVALASRRDDVDDDRLRAELDVEERDVESLRTTIVERSDDA